jgi:hypothetical protein
MTMREEYLAKLSSQLKEWELRLDELRDKAEHRVHFAVRFEDMRKKLEELRAETGDRWDVLRMGFESAWDELKTAFDTALSSANGGKRGQPGGGERAA